MDGQVGGKLGNIGKASLNNPKPSSKRSPNEEPNSHLGTSPLSSSPVWQIPRGVSKGNWDYVRARKIAEDYDDFLQDDPLTKVDWQIINRYLPDIEANSKSTKPIVADFGCGTGALCNKVSSNNITPIGYDPSEKMIKVAQENSPNKLKYISGSLESIVKHAPYDLITALMVLQFLENINESIENIVSSLKPKAIFWFAVHNEEYVFSKNNSYTKFTNLKKDLLPKEANIILSGESIKTFVRSSKEYTQIMYKNGLKKELEWYSEKYSDAIPPKYLVMAFSKQKI